MKNIIQTQFFKNANDLINAITPWNNNHTLQGFIFRGNSQEDYELTPSSLRITNKDNFWNVSGCRPIGNQSEWENWQIHAEYQLLREFYRLADRNGLVVPVSNRIRNNIEKEFDIEGNLILNGSEKWIPNDLQEVAGLAQHNGIPTRLLDWTYDPFIALYFAFRGALEKKGNMVIWCLNKEYISNLKITINRINIEFITPHYAGNPNLYAQKGLFTHWPIERLNIRDDLLKGPKLVNRQPLDKLITESLLDSKDDLIVITKLILPCSEACDGCKYLDQLGYDSGRVFPGYSGIAEQILNRYKYYSIKQNN